MLRIPSIPLQSVDLISSTTARVLFPPQYFRIGTRPLFTVFIRSVILSFSSFVKQAVSAVVANMHRKSAPFVI